MPKAITVPSFTSVRTGTKNYRAFRGVDYSTDQTQIDDTRSPRAINMIADEGGFPERRWGWRTVYQFAEDEIISGIFPFEGKIGPKDDESAEATAETGETPEAVPEDTARYFVIHAGSKLYLLKFPESGEPEKTELKSGIRSGGRSQSFYMNGKLYILTGAELLVYDGDTVKDVSDDAAYVPLTSYQRQPTGGGQAYESVNMVCKYRRNRFVGDGSSTTFQLDVEEIDEDYKPTAKYHITGEAITVSSFDAKKGTVTFSSAPKKPDNAGTSNVEIQFAKTTEDRAKIFGCTIYAVYGADGSSNRVFLSGNDENGATEWFSGLNDPTYWPDINYSVVGSSDFPIMCYVKAQGELLVIKKDNRQEGTIWHHASTIVSETAAFPLKEGVPGYGAIARYSAANLNDDPLYLSPRGVYAPATTYNNNIVLRQLYCRSRRVNPKLLKEENLADAVCGVWRGWYLLVLNDVAYIADGNQNRENQGYEWYYWTNIPAHVLQPDEQTLYFGTRDGRICRFNDDMLTPSNDVMMSAYNDDGAAIRAEWATKLDTMGTLSRLKTMPKRGSSIHLKAYTRSKIDVYIRTDADSGQFVKTLYADMLNFEDINFERFTFNTSVNSIIPLLVKKKKWKAIQFILISDAVNEGFGVYEIEIKYEDAGEAKK